MGSRKGRSAKKSKAPHGAAPQRHDRTSDVAPPLGSKWFHRGLLAAGCVYLSTLFLNGAARGAPAEYLPRWMNYFVQTTCLFPRASVAAIDYRLEIWDCRAEKFGEIDARAYFPMHADDKESRLHRVGHFYRRERIVMQELERYVLERHTNAEPNAERRWGGIRFSSVRLPLPKPGAPVPRWSKPPLAELPEGQFKHWFFTPMSRRRAHCAGEVAPEGSGPGQFQPSYEPSANQEGE